MTNTINNLPSNATVSKRVLNAVVDVSLLSLISIGCNAMFDLSWNPTQFSFWLLNVLLFVYYYAICESACGRTLGKFVTNTKAIQLNGQLLTTDKAVLRSFLRLIPFDFITIFTGADGPWHDTLSGTCVVDLSTEKAHEASSSVSFSNGAMAPESTFDHFIQNGYKGGYAGGHNNFETLPAGGFTDENDPAPSDYKRGDLYK